MMARVDPDDDSVRRYVLWHYRFDDRRNERRNVASAAFDSEIEFLREFGEHHAASSILKSRRRGGARRVPRETVKPIGYARLQQRPTTLRGRRSRVRKRKGSAPTDKVESPRIGQLMQGVDKRRATGWKHTLDRASRRHCRPGSTFANCRWPDPRHRCDDQPSLSRRPSMYRPTSSSVLNRSVPQRTQAWGLVDGIVPVTVLNRSMLRRW